MVQGPIPYGNVVPRWFDRRRGLSLGQMMLGIGSGAMIMPFLARPPAANPCLFDSRFLISNGRADCDLRHHGWVRGARGQN
jgi:hypothetical protein